MTKKDYQKVYNYRISCSVCGRLLYRKCISSHYNVMHPLPPPTGVAMFERVKFIDGVHFTTVPEE